MIDLFMNINLSFFAQAASKIAWEDASIENLRTALLGVPYILAVAGVGLAAFEAKDDRFQIFKAILLGLLVAGAVAGYRDTMQGLTDAFWEMRGQDKDQMDGDLVWEVGVN